MGNCTNTGQPTFQRQLATEKLGRSVLPLPWGVRSSVFQALLETENRLGRPFKRNEAFAVYKQRSYFCIAANPFWMVLGDLFRNDELLCDYEQINYSVNPQMQDTPENPTGFELYSDRMKRQYPDYILGKELILFPGPKTPVVNFHTLKDILLSTDLSQDYLLSWTNKGLRFLDDKVDLTGNRVAFQSFPRTGNTMTRRYVEKITGIYTGNNMQLIITQMHQGMDQAGEGHLSDDNSVWITKTHWPFPNRIDQPEFDADKIFVITRNPIDVLSSLFLFYNTASHSMTSQEHFPEAFPQQWDNFIREYVQNFKRWHQLCIQQVALGIPHYFMRYEDTTHDANQTMTELFKVLFD